MTIFDEAQKLLEQVLNWSQYSKALVISITLIGVLTLLVLLVKFISELFQGIRLYVCARLFACCQVNFVERYGKWAVVTGATDGIGQAIAQELAKRGMSILVVSRNAEKLARTKAMLEDIPNVGEVETVQINLADSSVENFERARRQIDPDNRDIGILVNNAGTFPDRLMRFNRFELDDLLNIANLNMLNPIHMTRMIMPGMVKRGRGMVMNVSSVLGHIVLPYISIYAATKAFMNSFTRQLQIEYNSHPIDIVLLTPGPVQTNRFAEATTMTRASLFNPTPEDYARSAISAASTRCNNFSGSITHGLIKHSYSFIDCIGLFPFSLSKSLRFGARNYNFSPVPKRKHISDPSEA